MQYEMTLHEDEAHGPRQESGREKSMPETRRKLSPPEVPERSNHMDRLELNFMKSEDSGASESQSFRVRTPLSTAALQISGPIKPRLSDNPCIQHFEQLELLKNYYNKDERARHIVLAISCFNSCQIRHIAKFNELVGRSLMRRVIRGYSKDHVC